MDFKQWIEPELAALLAGSPPAEPLTDLSLPAVRQARREAAALANLSADVERTDHVVDGPGGSHEIRLRVHRPTGLESPTPCVLFVHGGGYVLGSYDMDDLRLERLCRDARCVAVSVDYRLAPETPYPGALEDCYAALRWVHQQAGPLGVDAARTGVAGGSAGGGLAAALAILGRDRAELPIAFQLLAYPMLDDRATTRSSGWQAPVWDPAANAFAWRAYLGRRHGSEDVPATAAPARATDLAGLPPAFVCVGTADVFFDEDVAYAQALGHAGVPTELHVYAGAVHGFESIAADTTLAHRARRDMVEWLDRVAGGAAR